MAEGLGKRPEEETARNTGAAASERTSTSLAVMQKLAVVANLPKRGSALALHVGPV